MVSSLHLAPALPQLTSRLQTLPPAIMRRLTRELARLHSNPPEDYRVVLNEEDILDVAVWIRGPGAQWRVCLAGIVEC